MIQKLTRQASKAYRIPFETILTYYETFWSLGAPVKCYVRIRFFNWGSKFGLWDGGQTDIVFLYCKVKSDFQSELKGQVALEDNFRFVQDKSDSKSASDKKFVRKATVALENKICEQNITPCCERHAISREAAFTRCFNPQTATRGISKCFHEEF